MAVEVVPATDDVPGEIVDGQAGLGGHPLRLAAQRIQVLDAIYEAAGPVPVVPLYPAPGRHLLHLEQLAADVDRRGGLLEDDHVFVFEDVVPASQCAVTPQVGGTPLAPFISRDVLDHDGFGTKPRPLHALQAVETQRDQFPFRVLVANDQDGKATWLQQVVAVTGGGLKLVEEGLQAGRVGQVGGLLGKTNDVVVGRMKHQQLGVLRAHSSQRLPHLGRRLGVGRVTLQDVDAVALQRTRDLRPHRLHQTGLQLDAHQPPVQPHRFERRGPRAEEQVEHDVVLPRVAQVRLGGDLRDEVAVVVELVATATVAGLDHPQRVGPDVVIFPPAVQVDVRVGRGLGPFPGFASHVPLHGTDGRQKVASAISLSNMAAAVWPVRGLLATCRSRRKLCERSSPVA